RALEILQTVQKFAAGEKGEGGTKAILMQLAMMVKDQVLELRKKRDKEALDKAVKNYTEFLNRLYEGEKTQTPEFLRVMAEAYGALGQHEKAVELARSVREPRPEDFKDDKGEKDEKAYQVKASNYHFCRFLVVRQLREGGKAKEAAAELEEIRKT